jgi:hypothetical protein
MFVTGRSPNSVNKLHFTINTTWEIIWLAPWWADFGTPPGPPFSSNCLKDSSNSGDHVMAEDKSDFQKLLSEAPLASSADTVTVVGTLSRTPDAAHFMLTLADGRSVTLDVNAVKSAKKIAGAIGQSMVQLELDAKHVPEGVREMRPDMNFKAPAAETHPAIAELNTFIADQGHTGVFDPVHTGALDPAGTGAFDPVGTGAFDPIGVPGQGNFMWAAAANTPWYADTAHAPFIAATPHQADPRAMAALSLFNNPFNGPRTYFSLNVWTTDHHIVMKPTVDMA